MKLKNALFALLALLAPVAAWAQTSVANQTQIRTYYGTKTMVVLEAGMMSDYNAEIEDAMAEFWTQTPYEVITLARFDQIRRDPAYSFLIKTTLRFDDDPSGAEYDFLSLLLGGPYAEFDDLPELANFPLAYAGEDQENYIHRLGTIVRFLQNHVDLTRDNPRLNSENIIDFYNSRAQSINDKDFHVLQKDLAEDVNSLSEIASVYGGKVILSSPDQIEELIASRDPSSVFLHKVGPVHPNNRARCWKLIFGTDDAQLYYFDHHLINRQNDDGLLKADFRKLKRM